MERKIALEEIVSKLPGVRGAKVLIDSDGEPKEIHILADIKKPAKQLVRDVETAIYAASGIRIDRKIVSVAQIAADEDEGLASHYESTDVIPSARFNLISVRIETNRRKLTITVTVDDDGKVLTGSSIVDIDDDEKYIAAVEATVAAIRESIPSFRVEVIERIQYGLNDILLVVCSAIIKGRRRKEAGARLFRKDSFNDVVLVILDTLNRM